MPLRRWLSEAEPVAGAPGVCRRAVDAGGWRAAAQDVAASGGRLLTLWASADAVGVPCVWAAYAAEQGVLLVSCAIEPPARAYPALDDLFPAAVRQQRAVRDLSGLQARAADDRPWLRHAAWPADYAPLADAGAAPPPPAMPVADDYAFVRVEGDGVHEIPVGPVHAGIIEPGHFRFSIVGEKVLRLEERLGYVHKGIERRFTELALADGQRLAARISGDSGVAFSWAYCQALEGMAGCVPPPRAAWLRALALELERSANHLGDLGALGNDAGFAFGLSQFSRLKELCLRATEGALGQRYLLDYLVPGGTRADLEPEGAARLAACVALLAPEVERLRQIYDEHAGVRDRFAGAGTVAPALARQLGLAGLAGRASGQAFDLRADSPWVPYGELAVRKAGQTDGDVAARVAVRFDELIESLRLVAEILKRLPPGPCRAAVATPPAAALGVGLIEGWRGPVLIALESAGAGRIWRCHPHDPSSLNWPVLEHAVIGNIVPDFPLINKSFNLSYSGHDL